MSEFYVGSNKENAREFFEKRMIYTRDASNSVDYANLVDFNFGEKFLYGRVNRLFVPMILNTTALQLSNLKSDGDLLAVNFVVDAFNDMMLQFNKATFTGQIDTNDPFLGNLNAYKGWKDPEALYSAHLTSFSDSMAAAIGIKNTKIKNFDEFLVEYEALIKVAGRRFPFTKPAFIKSRICPINCSGLVIEIADSDPANDEDKMKKFINSKNWEFYVSLCNSYGFMVDRFVPWRLVADIGSTQMEKYASRYGFKSTDMVLDVGYAMAHTRYFQYFKYYLLNLYNTIKPSAFEEMEECGGITLSKIITPQDYSIVQLSKIYSTEFFLKLYFKTRFIEEESFFEDFEAEMLVDDCLEIYQSAGLSATLIVFERILNKPFDYRGSLSYIIKQVEAIAAEPV